MREGESIRASDVRYLPIVSAFAGTVGVVEEVDRLCGHKNGISPGRTVLALMVDALSGRTPLSCLPQAFAELETELLLGGTISPEKLNDDAVDQIVNRHLIPTMLERTAELGRDNFMYVADSAVVTPEVHPRHH